MSKFRKIFFSFVSIASVASILAIPLMASSCTNKQVNSQKEVIFAAPQGARWPLMKSMSKLIDYYNQKYKDDKDFIKVKLQTAEDLKTYSSLDLVNNTINNIQTHASVVPNVLLSNQSGAFILKSRNALLDLQKEGLNVKFNDKIQKLHSILAGQTSDNVDQLYNMPLDICDTDALTFNLDVMAKLFSIIESNGGTVDHNMDLYKKALKATTEGNSIPEKSAFNAMIAKSSDAFKNIHVDANTFSSFASIRKFVNDVYDNVTFDSAKLDKVTENARLLSIDYQEDVFLKELQAKNSGDNRLWSLVKTDDQNQPTKVDFSNLLNNDSEPAKNFVSLYNDWKSSDKGENIKQATAGINAVSFRTFDYKTNGNVDWGNNDIRKFDTAIAYAASVGANRSQQNLLNIKIFLGGDLIDPKNKAEYDQWATHYDVELLSSVDRETTDGKKVYNEGGSSIVGVKSLNKSLNKATVKFLNFLYNGSTMENGKDVPNYLLLAEESGYIVPFKEVVTQQTLENFKTQRDQYIKDWETNKNSNDNAQKAQADSDLVKANYLQSAIVSLQSLLNFVDNAKNVQDINTVGNDKTAKIINEIKKQLLKMTTITPSGTLEETTDGQTFLKELQDIAKNN